MHIFVRKSQKKKKTVTKPGFHEVEEDCAVDFID